MSEGETYGRERACLGDPYWIEDHAEIMVRYLFAGRFAAGRRVLDAAIGTGYGAATLGALGASFVHGIDKDKAAVDEATRRYATPTITFAVDDCEHRRTVRSPVDMVCSFETIEHLDNPEAFLAAVVRVLAPGGIFVCSTPDRASTPPFVNARPQNSFHRYEWYRGEFAALLGAFFDRVDITVQISTFSYAERARAIGRLKGRRLMRLARWMPKWTGCSDIAAALNTLAVPALEDCPLVEVRLAQFLGETVNHVAVCGNAKS